MKDTFKQLTALANWSTCHAKMILNHQLFVEQSASRKALNISAQR
jgi:hypothetical protein